MSTVNRATISANALYWGLIPSARAGGGGTALLYAFEHLLPRPVDGLQVVKARLADGNWLVAGIDTDHLRRHLHEDPTIGPQTWELLPAAAPAGLTGIPPAVLARMNLLHGAFEPARKRRWRQLLVTTGLVILLAVGILAWCGVRRRVHRLQTLTEHLRRERADLIDRTLAEEELGISSSLPPSQRLIQALRRLEARTGDAAADDDFTAEQVLDALFTRWPQDQRLQVETVAVSDNRLTLRGLAQAANVVESLVRAVGVFDAAGRSWRTGDPDVHEFGGNCRFVITYRGLTPDQGNTP